MNFKIQSPTPALQFRSRPANRPATRQIVIHHIDHPTADIHEVHRWHLNRDFSGIGYNFFIDKQGNIWSGRGMEATGAHTNPPAGMNSASVGIACQGAYHTTDTTMPDAQFNALVWLCNEIRKTYGDIPINGHGELAATACPGRNFPLAELKRLEFRGQQAPTLDNVGQNGTPSAFGDIAGHWAEGDISELFEMDIVRGDYKGMFRPDDQMTRAEMATIARNIIRYINGE